MIRNLPLLILTLMLSTGAVGALEVRDTTGRTMDVEVLAYTKSSGNVKIKRKSDGQIFTVKISLFDAASQKAIADAAPVAMPDLRVQVSVGRRRAREGSSTYKKTQEISVTVKVENQSRDIDLEKSKFTVLLIGRNMLRYSNRNADSAKVLLKENFSGELGAGKKLEFECSPVITSYDSDRDSSNIGGWEYDGYLMVVQDAAGKVVNSYSNIGPVKVDTLKREDLLKKALDLTVGTETQRNLQRFGRPSLVP